ncbi:Crp/Fnr family transcriptional regulator [Roseomonas marmotae]|uniref:Crp/Fnr family transcriptional regulator n=1 Tax=Roseomonas marmotae TaxID=2768161 RepID=A0ABS3KA13_9PROT|nr:Crp/Fnr family transcriptional regulator [Roseomonas marmotae]QTI80969.1 Crp/Fnr family transcriptional regulator [Roseomonas marmotae]
MSRPCNDCKVRDQSLCSSLSDEELSSLNSIGHNRKLERGQTLLWAGDEAALCANLLEGVLKLSATLPDGREQIVGLLYPADFVGRPFSEQAEHTVTALTDAELCVFPRKPFEEALEEHSRMERLLLRRTLAALDEARNRMLMLGRKTAEEKVASFLLDMALHLGKPESRPGTPVTFDLPLTRAQMADVLGLTIETVSRQMTRLKRAGLIDLPSGRLVTILDRDALEERAEAA